MAVLSIGHIGNYAVKATQKLAAEGLNPGHYDMRFCKPLDEELLHNILSEYQAIVTVEDGCLQGGFGAAILEFMADHGYSLPVKRLGIPDRVVEHGTQDELYKECGFDADGIAAALRELSGKVVASVSENVLV